MSLFENGGMKVERVGGMCFAVAALIALSVLEALHIVFLGSFNEAIFNAINGLVGTIIGIIIGRKV